MWCTDRKGILSLACLSLVIVIGLAVVFIQGKTSNTPKPQSPTEFISNTIPSEEAKPTLSVADTSRLEEIEAIANELTADLDSAIIPDLLPVYMTIAEDIYLLRQEDTLESLKLLSEVDMFVTPGVQETPFAIAIPFDEDVGSLLADLLLSNRRVLKLYQELSLLSKSEAAKLISEEIEASLPVYKKMFDDKWENVVEMMVRNAQQGHGSASAVSLVRSNQPNHEPTLAGMRYKLLSLALLAGNLELEEAHPAISKLVDYSIEQREHMYSGSESMLNRCLMLAVAGTYNRQILATGLIGTNKPSSGQPGIGQIIKEMPHFDTKGTPYDFLQQRGLEGVDYSKGKFDIWIATPMDDQTFDDLIAGF